jgi:hypothetical protein
MRKQRLMAAPDVLAFIVMILVYPIPEQNPEKIIPHGNRRVKTQVGCMEELVGGGGGPGPGNG